MSMKERNAYQMRLAKCYARTRKVDEVTALTRIARAFSVRYPNSTKG